MHQHRISYLHDLGMRHEKWIEWKRSGRYAEAEAAVTAHAEKHAPREDAPVVHRPGVGRPAFLTLSSRTG
jgi:hypothetical protein